MVGSVHRIVGMLVIVGLLAATACAPAAAPAPTAAPAKPAATAASAPKPAAAPTATQAAKPAVEATKPAPVAPAKPAASAAGADWKAEWDKVLAAAKKEGKVTVAGGPGDTRRKAMEAFQKAYPDIKLEYQGISGAEFATKVITERDGGQYLWDVTWGGPTTINSRLRPKGAIAPMKSALILPEVLDDTKWLNGLDGSWVDKERQYIFAFVGYLNPLFAVNRDFVPASELSKLDQLLEPKWKGKLTTQQMYSPGTSGTSVGWLLLTKGEEWLRKFYAQEPIIANDSRTQVEAVVRGRAPIMYGFLLTELKNFQKQGLGKNVVLLDPENEASQRLTVGIGGLALMDKAPHPNAAKVYINWLLSKEGQTAFSTATGDNSRRLDATGGRPETASNPKVKYRVLESEELYPYVQKANAIAKEVIK